MRLVGKSKLEKLKAKNRGNIPLSKAIDNLISDLEEKKWFNPIELKRGRPDADLVHREGFYFFNLNVHRTMILIEFEEDGEANIVWCGTHQQYEPEFKNNKNSIEKWLRNTGFIK